MREGQTELDRVNILLEELKMKLRVENNLLKNNDYDFAIKLSIKEKIDLLEDTISTVKAIWKIW